MSSRTYSSFESVPVFVGGKTWGYSEISEGSNGSWRPVTPESSEDSSSMWRSKETSSSQTPPLVAVEKRMDHSSLCVGDVLARAIEAEMKLEESEKRAVVAEAALRKAEKKLQKSDMECGRILQMLINAKSRIRQLEKEEERYSSERYLSKDVESEAWRLLERSLSIGENIRSFFPKDQANELHISE